MTEAANAAGDEFGEDRLMRTLRESSARSPQQIWCDEIVNAVSNFSEASLVDDITVVAIRGILY